MLVIDCKAENNMLIVLLELEEAANRAAKFKTVIALIFRKP